MWGGCVVLLKEKLLRFQNKAARIVNGAKLNVSSSKILEQLNWKNLENRFRSNKLTLIYEILNNGTASCLRDFFLQEAIMIITIIFEIMILISRFLKLRKNFLRGVSDTEVLFYGTVFLMQLKLSINLLFEMAIFN